MRSTRPRSHSPKYFGNRAPRSGNDLIRRRQVKGTGQASVMAPDVIESDEEWTKTAISCGR